jgi:hypothetical protein
LAVAFEDEPGFAISDQATVHMEDTNPLPLAAAGTPPVVAEPAASLWQTDTLALCLILDMSWTLRAPGSVAWIENVTW